MTRARPSTQNLGCEATLLTNRTGHTLRACEWALALIATAVAVFYQGTFARTAGALWRDEVNGVNTALASSWPAMWRLEEFSSYPTLCTVFLRAWAGVGGSTDASWRLAGFLGALIFLITLWFVAHRCGRAAPVAAVSLCAVNPEILRWGTVVSAWALGAALALVTFVFVFDALEQPRWRRVAIAAASAVLTVQCVYQDAMLVAAIVVAGIVALMMERRWRHLVIPLAIGVAALASLAPYVSIVVRRRSWDALNEDPVTLRWLAGIALDTARASGPVVFLGWVAMAVVVAASVIRVLLGPADDAGLRRRRLMTFAGVAITMAVVGTLVLFEVIRYAPAPYYYFGLSALGVVCADVMAVAAGTPARAVRLVIAAVVVLTGVGAPWSVLHARLTDGDAVAAEVSVRAQPGDLIVVTPWYLSVSFTRYYHGPAEIVSAPPMQDMHVHRYDTIKAQMMSPDPLHSVFLQMDAALHAGRRVWVVSELESLVPDTRVPTRLAPPPLAESGWREGPYEAAWTEETVEFIAEHAANRRVVPIGVPPGAVEHMTLSEAWGVR